MAPPTMKAYVTGSRNILSRAFNGVTKKDIGHGASVLDNVATPKIESNEILVKVIAVALNPTDWKHVMFLSPAHSIIGCDYVGEVVEVGAESAATWKVGDRVTGSVHGGLYQDKGSFAEYLKVEHDLAWKPPPSLSNRDAPTYGVSAATAMMCLYHNLDVPWPDDTEKTEPRSILIWAGSTTAGLYALQMAKNAGWRVVTTCSPHSYDLVKKYGADEAFDYRDPDVVAKIKKAYPDVTRAMDCISEGNSAKNCAEIMRANGGKLATLLPTAKASVGGVQVIPILAYSLFGKEWQWFAPLGPKWPANPKDKAAATRFFTMLPDLLDKIKPIPTEVVPGGFDGLQVGLDRLKNKGVSGRKLIVELQPEKM